MHSGQTAHDDFVAHGDVPGQGRGVGQDVVVADHAVVGDVRVGHHQVVRADAGHSAAALGAAMDGRKFADPVAVANDKRALFTAEFQVLGFAADAGHRMDMVFGAESREAFDLGSGVNDCFVADVNTVFDNGERANRHSGTQVRTRMNNR